MRKILGLDMGSGSIGWAVVFENDDKSVIVDRMGCRIVPLAPDDVKEFTSGNAITKNAKRTQRRTQRKGYDRFNQRRMLLRAFLGEHGMLPSEDDPVLSKMELWSLRSKAVTEQVTLVELGRVLLHLNQKRGYKSGSVDASMDESKQREYVKGIFNRYAMINEQGVTIGQYFYKELLADDGFRVKEKIFPRAAYEQEFDLIIDCQRKFYPEILDDKNIDYIRNYVMYYQRRLKSCKHLVSICDFEKRPYVDKTSAEYKIVYRGPKVAAKSSPLSQVCKIWESANNIMVKNKRGEELEITPSEREQIFNFMNTHERFKIADLYKILGLKKNDGWFSNLGKSKNGIQGNTTRIKIADALGGSYSEWLEFNLVNVDTDNVDTETGEICQIVSESFEKEPLYKLWHVLYSVNDEEVKANVLREKFGISDAEVISKLCALDFVKEGYASKSSRAMRRILPYLQLGLHYSEACEVAGFNHSNSITKEMNLERPLMDALKPIAKNELRQPIVEKILNQMVNVVNALMAIYGNFDEIRVELARELKQSIEERNNAYKAMGKAERDNEVIRKRINTEYNLTPTRSRVQKMKMWEEAKHMCFYCGQPVNVGEFLKGYEVEVEHILPKSLYFDDSFSNKVCACRKCNSQKNNRTAYDYMSSLGADKLQVYVDRVADMFKSGEISKTKYERLLTPQDKIPTDFISRQLRESQYIAKKAREILLTVSRDVTATSGSVTAYLRHIWGWDNVLHNLNLPRFKSAGMTEIVEHEHKSNRWSEEVIKGWSKREDHRHHAIDALTIACTKQGYIQRMNNMSATVDEEQTSIYEQSLKRYIESERPISVAEVERAADEIVVSFKAGKKLKSRGKRYVHKGGKRVLVQEGLSVPRGALHEESLYGSINRYAKDKKGNTVMDAKSVLRYPISSITRKNIDDIVDGGLRAIVAKRFESFGNEKDVDKKIWKDLDSNPLLFNGKPVKMVKCFTGIKRDSLVELERGFVKKGNNHHVAIYKDKSGKLCEYCVSFWHAMERIKYGLPVVITDVNAMWDDVMDMELSEAFTCNLPAPNLEYVVSFQLNDMFVLGMAQEDYDYAMETKNYAELGKYLYRVQKISSGDYYFRFHTETRVDDKYVNDKGELKTDNITSVNIGKMKRIGVKSFISENPQKVRVSVIGEIIKA